MRKQRHARTAGIGMDSLVDIVSNTVGILIILAVFMALMSRLAIHSAEPVKPVVPLEEPPKRILVPWSHATNKTAVFAYVAENRTHLLDLREFYARLAEESPRPDNQPIDVNVPGMKATFYPVTNLVYCLEFQPDEDFGETLPEMRGAGSHWRAALSDYPAEKFYYFFWVTGDSFDLFRTVRDELWAQQVEVGWKPVRPDGPLGICNGFDGSTAFQPQ
jgi:hypothetical protein